MALTPLEAAILANTLDAESLGQGVAENYVAAVILAREEVIARSIRLAGRETEAAALRRRVVLEQLDAALARLATPFANELAAARSEVVRNERVKLAKAFKLELPAAEFKLPVRAAANLANREVFSKKITKWIAGSHKKVNERAARLLAAEYIQGKGAASIERALREAFQITRNQASIVARTATLAAAADARAEVFKENGSLIESYTFMATLDQRTCPICGSFDGMTREKLEDLPRVPVHARCRCVHRPNTSFAGAATRPAVTEFSARTVRHRDGGTSTKWRVEEAKQVSAKTTYEEFFASQPERWQRQVLGRSRFELLKAGKIEFTDLVSKGVANRRVLRLGELSPEA